MTSEPTLLPRPQDHALLRNLLLKLTATQKITAAVVVTVVVLIWYDLLNRLLAFGDAIDYAALHVLGAEGSAMLQRYNPFFWWALVVLCTIIIAYFLYLFVQSTARRTRLRTVDEPQRRQTMPNTVSTGAGCAVVVLAGPQRALTHQRPGAHAR